MGADAADIGLTIHPHPTLSETIGMAAEAFEGTITDLYVPKKNRHGKRRHDQHPPSTDARGYLENLMRAGQDAMQLSDNALVSAADVERVRSSSDRALSPARRCRTTAGSIWCDANGVRKSQTVIGLPATVCYPLTQCAEFSDHGEIIRFAVSDDCRLFDKNDER